MAMSTNSGKYIPRKIAKLDEYLPNTDEYRIRVDANECPFAPSEKMLERITEAVRRIDFNRYPDPFATKLIEAISKSYEIPAENLVVGNGSDELISLICTGLTDPGDVVTVAVPDFSMYEFYSSLGGATVERYVKDDSMDIDLDELSDYSKKKKSKILILSNPCNPTGLCKSAEEIERFVRNTNALVVIDEAYNEFCEFKSSIFAKAGEFENLIALKTLSKAYGMAAIRLGIAASNKDLIGAIRKFKSPYNVNSVTQEIARIAVENRGEIAEQAKLISSETQRIYKYFANIQSKFIKSVYPTHANFVLIALDSPATAVKVTENMKKSGIAIRCFAKSGQIRISCGTPDENEIVTSEFVNILKELEK